MTKNKKILKSTVLNLVLFITIVLQARATVVLESSGGNDPAAAGFSISTSGTVIKGAGFDTEPYWFTNTTEKAAYYRDIDAADFSDPDGWTFTLRTKSLSANHTNVQDNWWCVRDAADRWDLLAVAGDGTTPVGVRTLTSAYGWSAIDETLDVTEYHTYNLIYNPTDSTASVYIDGIWAATYARTQCYNVSVPASDLEIRGGDQSGSNLGGHENRYSMIRFETGMKRLFVPVVPFQIGEGMTDYAYWVGPIGSPSQTVQITITTDGQTTVNGQSQIILTYDPGNPETAMQMVTVAAVDDSNAEGDHSSVITHTTVSVDPVYNGVSETVTGLIYDNDIPDVILSKTALSVTEDSADVSADTYTIKLNSTPSATVTINFNTDTQLQPISPIIFDASDWYLPQTITVKALDDALSEGPQESTIIHSATGDVYGGISIEDAVVSITDNEVWCGQEGTVYYPGDVNKDCTVNMADFALIARNWFNCTDPRDPGNCDFLEVSTKIINKQPERYLGWPSIAKLPSGRLVAVFSGDRDWHVCPWGKIQMVVSDDNGSNWSEATTIIDTPLDDRGPGILVTDQGTILVDWFTSLEFANESSSFYETRYAQYADYAATLTPEIREQWLGSWILRSEDNGQSWSDPIKIPFQTPHGPIQLSDGRILMVSAVGVLESQDDGQTWNIITEFSVGQYGKLSEVHAVELESGKIIAMSRAPYLKQFESTDGGFTWSLPVETKIYGYPAQLIRLNNNWLVIVYGRRLDDPEGQFACISRDGGETWEVENEIALSFVQAHRGTEEELGYPPEWDFGYPCSVLLDDNTIWTVYYQVHQWGEWPSIMGTHWQPNIDLLQEILP